MNNFDPSLCLHRICLEIPFLTHSHDKVESPILQECNKHCQVGMLTLIPNRAVLRLAGVPELNRVVELDQVESTLMERHRQFFLGQQTVRVSSQSQLTDVWNKGIKNGIPPATH
jgi:hypothetical protein